ncbi:hypothetical protein BX600DRAFT_455828, partial [Xylariales sp. PMI_506]
MYSFLLQDLDESLFKPHPKMEKSLALEGIAVGDECPESMALCPFKLVTAYPYMSVGNMNRERVYLLSCSSINISNVAA